MDQLSIRVDTVMSKILEQIRDLRAENDQKTANIQTLSKTISDLETSLATQTRYITEQQGNLHQVQVRFECIRAQQQAVIELLETKLTFSRRLNEKLCELISMTYQAHGELHAELERLKEEISTRDSYKEIMEKLLSESLQKFTPELPKLLEDYASDVQDALREKDFFETELQKFKSSDGKSRKTFRRLCRELIEKQKQIVGSHPQLSGNSSSQKAPPADPGEESR